MSETGKQSYTIDDFTTTYSTPIIQPGTVIKSEGQQYRFVKNSDTTTATQYYPCVFVDTDPTANSYEVAADLSDGILNAFAGCAMTDIATGEYGWLKRSGVIATATVIGTVTAAGGAIRCGDTDGQFAAAGANDIERIDGVCLQVVTTSGTGVNIWIDAL